MPEIEVIPISAEEVGAHSLREALAEVDRAVAAY
jgi:hypothetical protein